MKKILSSGLVIGAMISLVGCGDSSDSISTIGTAKYIDSAVQGVNYTCGTQEGITKADGEFTFEKGLGCTFYLGGIKLRDVDVKELSDGANLYEKNPAIASVLQGLDTDGDLSNGITINLDIVAAMEEANITEIPDTDGAALEDVKTEIENNGGTYVTVEDAQAHLDETAAAATTTTDTTTSTSTTTTPTTFVSGKSFDIGDGMILTFGSDYSYSDNDGCSGSWSEVTSNSIAVTGGCSFDVTFNGDLVDGVTVTINVTDVSPVETFDTTFTEVTSTTTPTSTADLLRSKLSSATYYGAGDGNIIEEMVFNPEVTFVSVTEVVGGSANYSSTLSLEGLVLTYVDAGNEQITFTEITDTHLVYTFDGGAGTSRWFTSQAAAQAYFGIN